MAYHSRKSREDGSTPVFCDTCAEAGELPFVEGADGFKHQAHPWCWSPLWGGIPSLDAAECAKYGISEHLRLGLCDKCKQPC